MPSILRILVALLTISCASSGWAKSVMDDEKSICPEGTATETEKKDNGTVFTTCRRPDGITVPSYFSGVHDCPAGTTLYTLYGTNNRKLVEYCKRNSDGLPQGVKMVWYENGNPKRLETYKNGVQNGVAKYWDKHFVLNGIEHFKDDKREGTQKKFFSNGKLESVATFQEDKPQTATKYNAAGQVILQEKFYPSGRLQGSYVLGRPNGSYIRYDDSTPPKMLVQGNFKGGGLSGPQVGTWRYFGADGKTVVKIINFDENGLEHGECIQYAEDGKTVIAVLSCKHGTCVPKPAPVAILLNGDKAGDDSLLAPDFMKDPIQGNDNYDGGSKKKPGDDNQIQVTI